jgi:cytochrome c553
MKNLAILAGLSLAIATGLAHADANSPTPAKTETYVPGLGEIMSLQQMRHAKLWLAASRGNWALANYEMDELREGFEDASRLQPTYEGVPVAALIASLTPAPLDAIGKAIKGKSAADFKRSFDSLTAACNTCHKAANHGFIQIRRPSGSAFSNQKFEPGPK